MAQIVNSIRPYFRLDRSQYAASLVAIAVAVVYTCFSLQHQYLLGAAVLVVAALLLLTLQKTERQYLGLFLGVAAIAIFTPMTTHTNLVPMIAISSLMASMVVLPQFFSQRVFGRHLLHINLDWHRKWRWWEVGYIALVVTEAYLLLPHYFSSTGAYTTWDVQPHLGQIAVVGTAIIVIGMWEEFFFIGIVYNILQRYVPAILANVVQATMFTMFLYRVGFHYYAPAIIFCYAFIQGLLFAKTKSLLYVLTVHFFADIMIFLGLVHAFFPDRLPIFLIS